MYYIDISLNVVLKNPVYFSKMLMLHILLPSPLLSAQSLPSPQISTIYNLECNLLLLFLEYE